MPAPEAPPSKLSEEIQDQPPREITQTDHLNKKLLTSLFKRMDEGGNSVLAKMLEPNDTDSKEENDEWTE